VAQTKSTQTGSSPARVGPPREQGRRTAPSTSAPTRPAIPSLGGAGGRRGRGNPLDFIRDVRSELRKVAWPSQRETVNLTIVVIALSVVVGLFLGGVDFVFQELFRFLLGIQGG
jgi:preprotein translocase subunit SecE